MLDSSLNKNRSKSDTAIKDAFEKAKRKAKKAPVAKEIAPPAPVLVTPQLVSAENVTDEMLRVEIQYISKHDLYVDRDYYQRREKPKHRKHIRDKFDRDLYTILIVSYRDGKYWIVEGQHRWLVALDMPKVTQLPCIVHHWTREQEAAKFAEYNEVTARAPVTTGETLKAAVAAGKPSALKFHDKLREYGFTLNPEEDGRIFVKWIGTLKNAYDKNPAPACWVLKFISRGLEIDMKTHNLTVQPIVTMFIVEALLQIYKMPSVVNNSDLLSIWFGQFGLEATHELLKKELKKARAEKMLEILEFNRQKHRRVIDKAEIGLMKKK